MTSFLLSSEKVKRSLLLKERASFMLELILFFNNRLIFSRGQKNFDRAAPLKVYQSA